MLKHSAEQDLYDQSADENAMRLKKERYFKLLKENEELKEAVNKREELLNRIERVFNPNLTNLVQRKIEAVRFSMGYETSSVSHLNIEESSSSRASMMIPRAFNFNFGIHSAEEHSTNKTGTNETEFWIIVMYIPIDLNFFASKFFLYFVVFEMSGGRHFFIFNIFHSNRKTNFCENITFLIG